MIKTDYSYIAIDGLIGTGKTHLTKLLTEKLNANPIFEDFENNPFLEQYYSQHGSIEIPLIVGILPLYNLRHAGFLNNEVPGITIPENIQMRMDRAGDGSAQEGVRIAVELVRQMQSWARGIYLMPAFNRYDLVVQIIDQIK